MAGPGLLLVSGLGGIVFAIAAVADNVWGGPQTETAVIVIHIVISLVSFGLLAFFVRGARRRQPLVAPAMSSVQQGTAGGMT